MLVLGRREREAVDVYDAAGNRLGSVVVTRVRGGRARLGFVGWDQAVTILRRELPGRPGGSPAPVAEARS